MILDKVGNRQKELLEKIKEFRLLDIHAVDTVGKKYNIEVQRADKGAGAKRARYNSSVSRQVMVNGEVKLLWKKLKP